MDLPVALRAALGQGVTLAVVAVILAVALPREFFVDWGWAAGPGAWAACALLVGRWLRLPLGPVLLGAGLAGLPSLVGVLLDEHWLGAPLGVLIFGAWCGWLVGRGSRRMPAAA